MRRCECATEAAGQGWGGFLCSPRAGEAGISATVFARTRAGVPAILSSGAWRIVAVSAGSYSKLLALGA